MKWKIFIFTCNSTLQHICVCNKQT